MSWHKVAHPSTWGCEHQWETIGLYREEWGNLVKVCVHCRRWHVVDLSRNTVTSGKGRWPQ